MAYAILRFAKHKGGASKALSAHHERTKEIYASNPDIDKNRTMQNYHIVTPRWSYEQEIRHRIRMAGCRVRKDSVKFVDTLVTVSPGFAKAHEAEMPEYFNRAFDFLKERVGEENIISAVVHMDEKTPHLHATVVPIVTGERVRRKREGEKKYETKSGPRLSADDVMRRTKLHEYQNSYAAAMKPFGLQRGIVGSTAKHQANSEYYRQQVIQYEEDIAKLQADVEKAQEGRSTILAWFGKGDLAKAKKELADKDGQIAELNKQIKALQAEKARLQEQHKSEIGKLRNGYQAEIEKAIRRAETAERQSEEKDAVIDRQRKQIDLLDRKANPQRYSLSSGAELMRINVSNYRNPSLHIWTRVGEELFEGTKFQIDYDVAQRHFNGQITDEEFVNTVFEPQEQVSVKQAELLGTAFTLAAVGPAQAHVGTGGGGSSSNLPWREQKKGNRR